MADGGAETLLGVGLVGNGIAISEIGAGIAIGADVPVSLPGKHK